MDKRIQITYENSVHFIKHEWQKSSPNCNWLPAGVRDFLFEKGIIRDDSYDFEIYDEDNKIHHGQMSSQNRPTCKSWFDKFRPRTNDWVVIFVVGKKAVFIHCPKS